MMCPHHLMLALGQFYDSHAHERCLPEIKAALPISAQILSEQCLLFVFAVFLPVFTANVKRHALSYDLKWTLDSFPTETGPQDTVPLNHLLPCTRESFDVE